MYRSYQNTITNRKIILNYINDLSTLSPPLLFLSPSSNAVHSGSINIRHQNGVKTLAKDDGGYVKVFDDIKQSASRFIKQCNNNDHHLNPNRRSRDNINDHYNKNDYYHSHNHYNQDNVLHYDVKTAAIINEKTFFPFSFASSIISGSHNLLPGLFNARFLCGWHRRWLPIILFIYISILLNG